MFTLSYNNIITTEEHHNIFTHMYSLLREYNYEPKTSALHKIIDEWATQKADLIAAFKSHPNYLPGEFMIVFDQDYKRNTDQEAANKFHEWFSYSLQSPMYLGNLPEEIKNQCDDEEPLPWKIFDTIDRLLCNFSYTIDAEESRYINDALPTIRAREGQRRTRIVNKIFTYLNYSTHEEYNRRFAEYADAITPMTIRRHTILSINPLDYLTMSFGNSWSSCHTIDKANIRNMENHYHGQYSSGTISYMLDPSSMVFYTVDASYEGIEYWNEPKIHRQMFHWRANKLVQGRLYPQCNDIGSNDLYTTYRNIVQEIMSTIYDFANLWQVSADHYSINNAIESNGTNYRDYENYDTCTISMVRDLPHLGLIHIGEKPICIRCGQRHNETNWIDCCKAHEGQYKCALCGQWHDRRALVELDGKLYCSNCISYCEHCGAIHIAGTGTFVNNYGIVCPDCIQDTNVFVKCDHCGEISFHDQMYTLCNNKNICQDCAERYYTHCQICGELALIEDITWLPGGANACPDCYNIFATHNNNNNNNN